MSKEKPKGTATSKPTSYIKEKEIDTLASSPGKDRPVGVTYARKKKHEGKVDTKPNKKPKKDEKEGDNTDTQSDVDIKEARRNGRNVLPTIDELVHGIKEFGGLFGVGRKYPLCNEENKIKIEDALMWNMHKLCRTPNELYGIVPSNLQIQIEGRWKTTLAIEKEHKIKALMEVKHDLDYNQASILVEACIQHFKIRNIIGSVTIEDVQGVHDESVSLWKTILSQQKEAEQEIEKEIKQDQGATALDKWKCKDKDSTEGFGVFLVDDIIGNVVSDILNLTKDVEQPIEHKSTNETIDIGVSPVKGTTQTKNLGEDEVIVRDITYEYTPHRTLVTTNPTDNEPLLLEKGAEKGNPKVINTSILPIE